MSNKKLTDENLRSLLWRTANEVYTGELDPKKGEVVAKAAREIISIEKTKIAAAKAGLISPKQKEQKLIG